MPIAEFSDLCNWHIDLYRLKEMTTIDIIILVFLGIGLVSGFMRGFLKQLASIVGLIAGLLVARA